MKVATFRIKEEDLNPILAKAKELNIKPSPFLREIVLIGFNTYTGQPNLVPAQEPEPEPEPKPEPGPNPKKTSWWSSWRKMKK